MKLSDIMGHAGLSIYAQIALVIFVAVFIGVLIYLFAGKRHEIFERAKMMPLDDGRCVIPRAVIDEGVGAGARAHDAGAER